MSGQSFGPRLPGIPPEHALSDRSTNLFKARLPRGWGTYEPSRDIGTDLLLRVARNNAPTGERIAVQLKSRAMEPWRGGKTTARMAVSTINGLLLCQDPAVLVLYCEDEDLFVWSDLRRWAKDIHDSQINWQEQETASVPLRKEDVLATPADFERMLAEAWPAKRFSLQDVEIRHAANSRAALVRLAHDLLEQGELPLADATRSFATTDRQSVSEEHVLAQISQHASALFIQNRIGQVALAPGCTAASLQAVFNIARGQAPQLLAALGWSEWMGAEDLGRFAADYVAELEYPVETVTNLRTVAPEAWVAGLSRLMVCKPEALKAVEGITVEQKRTGPAGDLPGTLEMELAFTDPDLMDSARALLSQPQRGFLVVRSEECGFLVETISEAAPDAAPPRLRVHGGDGPLPNTRTPMLVSDDTGPRWIVGLLGLLPDVDRPAVRLLTSEMNLDAPVTTIGGVPLAVLSGQQGVERFSREDRALQLVVDGAVVQEVFLGLKPDSKFIPESLRGEARAAVARGGGFLFERHLYQPVVDRTLPDHVIRAIEARWGPVKFGNPNP